MQAAIISDQPDDSMTFCVCGSVLHPHGDDQNLRPLHVRFIEEVSNHAELQENAEHVSEIVFCALFLHNWETVWLALRELGAPVTTLQLLSCDLSERGANTLAWLMTKQSGFHIQNLHFEGLRGNSDWVRGLAEISIRKAYLRTAPSHFLSNFFEYYRPQEFFCASNFCSTGSLHLSLSLLLDCTDDDNNTRKKNISHFSVIRGSGIEGGRLGADMSQAIVHALKSSRVNSFGIHGLDLRENDIFEQALDCREIIMGCNNFSHERLASSLIRCEFLRSLRFNISIDGESGIGNDDFNMFLENADLTNLDLFEIANISTKSFVFSTLCNQIEQNKISRSFRIGIGGHHSSGVGSEGLKRFGKSLSANTNIENLGITVKDVSVPILLEFFEMIMCGMPKLLHLGLWADKTITKAGNEEEYYRCKNYIFEQLGKNKTIKKIHLPFLEDDGSGLTPQTIVDLHRLLRCGNETSDGIWSHALSRIGTPSAFFYVVKQMPRCLFQRPTAPARRGGRTSRAVPHHPNCPGCKNQRSSLSLFKCMCSVVAPLLRRN